MKKTISYLFMAALILAGCSKSSLQKGTSTTATNQSQSGMVMTPFGQVPAAQVHFVEPGNEITVLNGRITKINAQSKAVVEDYGAFDPSIKAQLHARPIAGLKTNQVNATPSEPVGNGYLTYYTIPSGTTVSSFSTTWTVPNNPTNVDTPSYQTYFIWNGMESGDGNTFMQPVLEWGNINGARYDVANWGALNNNYFHGTAIDVNPGTTITGVMTLTKSKTNAYTYSIAFTGYPTATYTETYKEPANTLYECFETYNSNYIYWPNSNDVTMGTNVLILKGVSGNQAIDWTIDSDGAAYTPSGLNTLVYDNNSTSNYVNFYFK
jgi:hypothetical protein